MLGINLSLAALAVHAAAESAPRAVLSGLHDATTIAGAVGDPVVSWTGSTPGGAVYSPLATAPLIGSKNGVRFIEDVGSYRPLVTAIATEKQSRRIFIVARPDAVTSLAQRPLMGVNSAANRHIGLRYNTGTPAAIGIYGSPVAAESLPAATWALIEYEMTPAAVTCWIDGVEVFTAAGAPEGSVTLNTLLGGRHGGVNYRFNGAISMATEYDISPAPMSAGQIAAARAAGMFRAALLNSPELSYSLDPQDDGSFGDGFRSVGLLEVGTPLILAGPMELDNVLTVGSVFRVGGATGEANLSFATDADHLHRAYTSAPMIDTVGVALRISVANAGVVGRIAHTSAADALGFLLEVDAGILRVTVSDGEVTRVAERAVPAYGAPFGVAAAIGPSGLMLCAGDDGTIGDVIVTDRGLYVGPSADELFIGGAGVTIYGGSLYSPQAFDAANLIVAKNAAVSSYGGTVDPTVGMTLSATWDDTFNTNYFQLSGVNKFTAKIYIKRTATEFGVLLKSGADISGCYAIIWDDGSATGQLMMLMGFPNGSFASSANTAVVTTPAPVGAFEVVISGDSVTGQKAALYVDNALIGVDSVNYSTLAGGRKGAINRVFDQMASNPPGWATDGDGANTMVSSALIYVGEATAEVLP